MSSAGDIATAGWRGPILAQFSPAIAAVARLTIVADPDELLTEQGVLEAIRERGFDLIPFDDHVAFRFAYESRYRQRWDRGEETNLVVVLRSPSADVNSLPYDLLEKARRDQRLLSFSLAELFPDLAPSVVAELDRADFDALHAAEQRNQPGTLGANATKDFILRHVFSVAPEIVRSEADLLRLLLERHYRNRSVPHVLDERLVNQLRDGGRFVDWPLEELLSNRDAFFAFLEERWPVFVAGHSAEPAEIAAGPSGYGFRYQGPAELPFHDAGVRAYLDNLFVEGLIAPTDVVPRETVPDEWIRIGVSGQVVEEDLLEHFRGLRKIVEQAIPARDADSRGWLECAQRWAELSALRFRIHSEVFQVEEARIEEIHDTIESVFADWMADHFAALASRSYLPRPAMVHQVARYMAHGATAGGYSGHRKKMALVVVDGLALSQWVVLRENLKRNTGTKLVTDAATFAWVPTLTSVSRQSIFAAEAPEFFARSIGSTHKEKDLWRRFWEERGLSASAIGYLCQGRQETESAYLGRIREVAEHPASRVIGIVVGTIDQMMHGTPTGSAGLHAQVRHWAEQGHFTRLVDLLLEREFVVFVTADHGNLEAFGFGKPDVGATAEERGERVHVFSEELLREKTRREFGTAIAWPPVGLPEDYLALIAPGRLAFIKEGRRTVGHGGISLEEVVVPFVEIHRA